jgi:hypothetical protein
MIKVYDAYHMFERIVILYGVEALVASIENKKGKQVLATVKTLDPNYINLEWTNIGGQLMPKKSEQSLLGKIKSGSISSWNEVHDFYESESNKYIQRKNNHALVCLEIATGKKLASISQKQLTDWLDLYVDIKRDITSRIEKTRAKDYSNPFRKMVYTNEAEMIAVVGDLKDNGFINEQNASIIQLAEKINSLKKEMSKK